MIGGPTTIPATKDSSARSWLSRIGPKNGNLLSDAIAGVPGAIASVPDGMAASILAGVNPLHGLYASFAGPVAGGLTSSTQLMVVTTTSAAALAAGSTLASLPPADREEALYLLTLIAGLLMVAAALLKLGRYTRFVSHSVMTGFLTGVALNIIFGQVPDLTGAPAVGGSAIAKALNVLTHPDLIDVASLVVGLSALVLVVVLAKSRLASIASLLALAIPTVVVVLLGANLGADEIEQVSDIGAIEGAIPLPHLPELRMLTPDLLIGSLAVAMIVLVQGAGVSESAPNPDGRPSNSNRDFFGQGVGNLASALFKGQPVGGSVGQTAVNITNGGRTRWAAVFSGLWMLVILVAFGGLVGQVAVPTLAAVLVVAGFNSLRFQAINTILRTGAISQIAFVTTFLSTLFLPVAAAVGIGTAISLLLQLNREALDLRVVELIPQPGGRFAEGPVPSRLEGEKVTVLDVYGSLYYAGARTLQARLPDLSGAVAPVVVLRLRGRTALSSTSLVVLQEYASELGAAGGRLYLSGVDQSIIDQLERLGHNTDESPLRALPVQPIIGQSTADAYEEATAWLARKGTTQ